MKNRHVKKLLRKVFKVDRAGRKQRDRVMRATAHMLTNGLRRGTA